jgi:hypothetical protein
MSDLTERIATTTAELRRAAETRGALISGDGRVNEEVAARLLGIAPGTLSNHRRAGTSPQVYRPFGRPTYKLVDLAELIERVRTTSGWD